MSTVAEAEYVGETVHLSASDSAVDINTGSGGRAMRSGQVAVTGPSANANRKQNPARHRVFKTMCLYASFGTMVRLLKRIRSALDSYVH